MTRAGVLVTLLVTTSTTAVHPRVRIAPTIRKGDIDDARVRAFEETLAEEAAAVFEWRRWEVASAGAARVATHRLSSELAAVDPRDCVASVRLMDSRTGKVIREASATIAPCAAGNVLAAAADLALKVAGGPRASQKIDLDLTPLAIPSIDIPDIEDVTLYVTSTAARTRSGYGLDRALEIYRDKHLMTFLDEGQLFIARGGMILNDCDVLRVASMEVTRAAKFHCNGNWWELAWGALPLGALAAVAGLPEFLDGSSSATVVFVGGTLTAIAGPILVLLFNQDAAEPWEHYFSESELEEIISASNAFLRNSLGLSEAEVTIAGMRL